MVSCMPLQLRMSSGVAETAVAPQGQFPITLLIFEISSPAPAWFPEASVKAKLHSLTKIPVALKITSTSSPLFTAMKKHSGPVPTSVPP